MVSAVACFSPTVFSPLFRREQPSRALKLKSGSIPSITPARIARSINCIGAMEEKQRRSGWKEYLEQAKEMIKADGGPPRWFSPLDGGSPPDNSPLMLFLPGIDGVGLGLVSHHNKLKRLFDLWCLHIPFADRTPFTDLVKLVETTIRSEYQRSPNRPIYLLGESLGGCLALAVATRNSDIDLVLILANPATSFGRSQVQLLTSLLDVLPATHFPALPNILSISAGDILRMLFDNTMKGLPLLNASREPLGDFSTFASSIPVLADILPKETFLWKLKMLKSPSAYADSHLYAINAQTLILCSGNDQLLPSQQEGERLYELLPNCELRKFHDSGHFLFLEGNFDLVMVIKGTSYYRRGKYHDYDSDFIPATRDEVNKIIESYSFFNFITSSVMLSTLEDGKIVKGLAGIPSEGPVLLVGNHMLVALDKIPLLTRTYIERGIILRGLAHPFMFSKFRRQKSGRMLKVSFFDWLRVMGIVPVTATNLFKLFSSKSHVLLFPGGVREAFHRKGEEYKLFWPEQSEFVRMAARFGAKIVPFGAVGEDDLFQMLFDYDDLAKIPYVRSVIKNFTNEAMRLRIGVGGEVENQQVYPPGILPKVSGRFYFYFGKPIETEGREQELKDKKKSQELYIEVKTEVERCIAYLKEKREKDPYRSVLTRSLYQATHSTTSDFPTFEI